jgi:hypothetical protein
MGFGSAPHGDRRRFITQPRCGLNLEFCREGVKRLAPPVCESTGGASDFENKVSRSESNREAGRDGDVVARLRLAVAGERLEAGDVVASLDTQPELAEAKLAA